MRFPSLPTNEQILLFNSIDEELKLRSDLSESQRHLIAADFVLNYDFSNTALAHKSAGGWAQMILSELE